MTAKEAIFAEMGWAEDAKDAPGQMPLPGFENTIKNWGQKSTGKKKGMGAAPAGGGAGGAFGGSSASSPAGSPQGELEAHDKKNHPNGYKGGRCKLRGELAAKGFDVRGYDAKVHNFTAPEGYDYNVDNREGDGEEESGEGKSAIGEQGGEERKAAEVEPLPEPEKVDIGGTEITAMTEEGKKTADLIARFDKEPEKVIAEHEEFAGLNPEEVKEKTQEEVKKLSENPVTNADAKTQAQQQAAQQAQAQAQQAQHEQAIAAGNELNAEVSSEAGQLDLLAKNHEQAVADIAQQIKALNGKEPETTALKNELVKENKKFEKEFQKIDPVAQNEDGTPESPDDHAKHCKANPKSNCPFLKGAMTPEQLQQLDAQSANEDISKTESQGTETNGNENVPGEGPESERQSGAETDNSQYALQKDKPIFKPGPVTDEEYERFKQLPLFPAIKQKFREWLLQRSSADLSGTEKVPLGSLEHRITNEVVAELKAEGHKIEEWRESDVVEVINDDDKSAEGQEENADSPDQGQIDVQKQLQDNTGPAPALVEKASEETKEEVDNADDFDFDDDGDIDPGKVPPQEGTPRQEQEQGQEKSNGQQKQPQPFVDNGRRPGLMNKRDWTPEQREALKELAKRFGAAAEGLRNGVSDEKFDGLLHNISHFTNVRNKWATTPNTSEQRQVTRDALSGVMDKKVEKTADELMVEQIDTLLSNPNLPVECRRDLGILRSEVLDPNTTDAEKKRQDAWYGSLKKKYGLDKMLTGKGDGASSVNGYREDGDDNHKKGLPTISNDADKNYKVDISGIPDVETHNGSLTNGDEITQKIAKDISAQTNLSIDPSDIKVTPLMAMTEFSFAVPEGITLTKAQGDKILEAIQARFPLKEIQKGNEKAPQKAAYTFDTNTQTFKISVENETKGAFSQKKLLESKEFQDAVARGGVPVILGVDAQQRPIVRDLTEIVHALMVGASGAGKSVMINDIITSILSQSPYNIRLGLVDLAGVELPKYDGAKHMVMPTATTPEDADKLFSWYANEMDARRKLFQQAKVKDLAQYNRLGQNGKLPAGLPTHLPYLPLIVDEFSDLMDSDVKSSIVEKLNKMSREARKFGVHMFLATQKGTTDFVPSSVSSQATTRIGLAQTNSDNAKRFGTPDAANIPTRSGGFQMKIGNALVNGTSGILPDEGYDEIAKRFSDATSGTVEGENAAAPEGETAAPTQSTDQIIDGLAKTEKGKAGLKAIADRLAQGNIKPISVGEKVADMTKKLLDGMGYGYTEMKGADGKVIITPKPKEQAPEAQKQEQPPKPAEGTQEVKPNKTPEGTSSSEGNNAPETGAGGNSESGSGGDATAEAPTTEPTALEKQKTTERDGLNAKAQEEYNLNHDAFDESMNDASKTYQQEVARAKGNKKAKLAAYNKYVETKNMEMAAVNVWRSRNGLKPITDVNDDGSYQLKQEPNTEAPQEGSSSPETSESASKEAVGSEEQGAEPAKEGTEAKGENMFADPDGVGGVSNEFKRDSLEVNASKLNEAYQAYKNAKPGTKEWEAAKKDFAKVLKEDNALRKELGLNPRNENGRVVRAVNAPPPKEEANTAEAPADTEPTGEEEPSPETPSEPEENPYLDSAELEGMSEGYDKDELQDNAAELQEAQKQYEQSKQGSTERRKARDNIRKILKRDNAIRVRLGMNQRGDNGHIVKPAEQGSAAKTDEAKATAQEPAENPYLDKAEIDGVDGDFNKADLEDGARRLNNAMNQWREARKSNPDSDETQQAREAFSAALEKDNALRKELGLPERDKNGRLPQAQNAAAQEPAKNEKPASSDLQETKGPENSDGTEPPADNKPTDGGDDDDSPPDDGGGDDGSGGGSGGDDDDSPPDDGGGDNFNALNNQVQPAKTIGPDASARKYDTPADALTRGMEDLDAKTRKAMQNDPNIQRLQSDLVKAKAEHGENSSQYKTAAQMLARGQEAYRKAQEDNSGVTDVRTRNSKPKSITKAVKQEGDSRAASTASAKPAIKPSKASKATSKTANPDTAQPAKEIGTRKKAASSNTSSEATTQNNESQKDTKENTAAKPSKVNQPVKKPDKNPDTKQETPKESAPAKQESTPNTSSQTTEGSPELRKAIEEDAQVKEFQKQADSAKKKFGENSEAHKTALKDVEKAKSEAKVNSISKVFLKNMKWGTSGASTENDEGVKTAHKAEARKMAQGLIDAINSKNATRLKAQLASFAQVGQGGKISYPEDSGSREAFEAITGIKLPVPDKALGDFKEEPIEGATEGFSKEDIEDMSHFELYKQGYQKRIEAFIDDFCGTKPEPPKTKSSPQPQSQKAKPAETPKQAPAPKATAASKPNDDAKKSENKGMTPEYEDYLKRKEAREKAEAEKQAKMKAEREARLRQAQMGRSDNSRGLNNQKKQFELEAMKKTDPAKSENYKALSALKPPEKIDNETAKTLNQQFNKVSEEIAQLEGELKRNDEERNLKPEEIQERIGMIGHLRQGLSDVFTNGKLGKGNFTFAKEVDGSGNIKGLRILSYKGADGQMSKVNSTEKKKSGNASASQNKEASTKKSDANNADSQTTKSDEGTTSTTSNQGAESTQSELTFGTEENQIDKDIDAQRNRLAAWRKKHNKKDNKGGNTTDEAIAEDGGIWIPVVDESVNSTDGWADIFDAAMFAMGGIGVDNQQFH